MDYDVDVNPSKAMFLVKEEFQNNVLKSRGIACAVYFEKRIFLLTSSSAVESTDKQKKLIAERLSRRHFGDYRLHVSVLRQLGNFTLLKIDKEYKNKTRQVGGSWLISLNLEIPSSERKASAVPCCGTEEFELNVQWDGNSANVQVNTTKSVDWTSILGVPMIIENKQSNRRQSGRFSVVGVVGLTSEGNLCAYFLDQLVQNARSLGKFFLLSHIHLCGLIFSD